MTNETINKVLKGKASYDDAAKVASWFQEPEGSMDLVSRIDADLNREWEKQHPYLSGWRVSIRHLMSRVAIALLIIAGCLAASYSGYRYFIQPEPTAEQVAYAARGERTQVVLQDGTRIYLNSESQITFPSRFSLRERRIHLDGEAYFEVSKNKHRPFVVEMDHAAVTVLGTQFNASSYDGEPVRVMLDEGSVRFSAKGIDDVMLEPGEQICYDTQLASARVENARLQSAGAWRNRRIDVSNMPLADMIRLLQRKYNVTFRVDNQRCYQHSYTLEMDDSSLNEVLTRMSYMSSVSFRYDEKNKRVIVR